MAEVHRNSAAAGALVAVLLAVLAGSGTAAGFAAGLLTAHASLLILEAVVRMVVRPTGFGARRKFLLGLSAFLKYIAVGYLLYRLARMPAISLPAFAAGFAVPQLMIFLQGIRGLVAELQGDAKRNRAFMKRAMRSKEA